MKLLHKERKKIRAIEGLIDHLRSRAAAFEEKKRKPAFLDRELIGALLWVLGIVYKYYGIEEEINQEKGSDD